MSVVGESDVRYGIIRPTATQGVVVMQSAEYWPWAGAWCIPQVHEACNQVQVSKGQRPPSHTDASRLVFALGLRLWIQESGGDPGRTMLVAQSVSCKLFVGLSLYSSISPH
jgi:hypothetical protein